MQKPEVIHFPIYRKYKNNKRFYKIINSKEVEELQIVGTKVIVHQLMAKTHPDVMFINDLIGNFTEFAVEITEKEYLQQRPV